MNRIRGIRSTRSRGLNGINRSRGMRHPESRGSPANPKSGRRHFDQIIEKRRAAAQVGEAALVVVLQLTPSGV